MTVLRTRTKTMYNEGWKKGGGGAVESWRMASVWEEETGQGAAGWLRIRVGVWGGGGARGGGRRPHAQSRSSHE